MIHVFYNKENGSTDTEIRCHGEKEVRANFQSFLRAVTTDINLTLIFLEEFNKLASKLEEELKNVQNNSSNEGKE